MKIKIHLTNKTLTKYFLFMATKNDKHFFNKIEKKERNELLEYLGNNPVEISIWVKNKPDKIEVYKTTGILSDKRITMESSGSLIKKIVKSGLLNKTVLLKFSIKKYSYFSTGHLSSGAEGHYYLLIENNIFKHEQRRDFRIEASRTHKIQFKVDGEVFEGIDISAGGVSFKAKIKHIDRFKKGNNYLNCKLKLNEFNCEVAAAKVVKNFETTYTDEEDGKIYKYLTVCLQFHGMSENNESALAQHIFNEARGLMLVKKLLQK